MKLQILVPQYKETDEVIKSLLDSIAIQQNVNFKDFEVIICNDGSDVLLSKDLLSSYPYKIKYYKEPHRGVSGTRNACLDHAKADYVMFCDADDMFCNVCGLFVIFREITVGFDVLISMFIEETRTPDRKQIVYVNREKDCTFVHGKIYRRKYLLDNNIRWNDSLTIHEDSYFNILCQSLSKDVKYCPSPFYLWKWRDESVCRHDLKYILKTYHNLIDSNDALIDELLKREITDKAIFYTGFMIFDAYYSMNKPEWINQENKEYRNQTEKRFAKWFIKHEKMWKEIDTQTKMKMSTGVRNRIVNEGMMMESVTIDGWLKKIKRLAKMVS